jgi:hypothetical protein
LDPERILSYAHPRRSARRTDTRWVLLVFLAALLLALLLIFAPMYYGGLGG